MTKPREPEEPAKTPHTEEEDENARKQADGVPRSYAGDREGEETDTGVTGQGGTGGG
jgi:hypothetical protein